MFDRTPLLLHHGTQVGRMKLISLLPIENALFQTWICKVVALHSTPTRTLYYDSSFKSFTSALFFEARAWRCWEFLKFSSRFLIRCDKEQSTWLLATRVQGIPTGRSLHHAVYITHKHCVHDCRAVEPVILVPGPPQPYRMVMAFQHKRSLATFVQS